MKILLSLFKNPRVVIFAVAHWMIVLYLLIENLTRKPSGFAVDFGASRTWQDGLSEFISVFDLPGILPAALLWSPAYIFGDWNIFYQGIIFISILPVTLEWLIIGKIVFNIFSSFESRMTAISLKDE